MTDHRNPATAGGSSVSAAWRRSHITRLVLVLVALHCLAFIDRTMIGGALPLLRQGIAMTDAQAGWIIGTAFAVPYGAAALGVAALRRGRPAATIWLVGGGLLWTAGSAATGLAGSLATLTAARAALGIGQGVFVPVAIARLLDGAAPDARGRALGLFTGGATFGRSTALLAVGAFLAVLGPVSASSGVPVWRWLFVLTAIPNVLVLIALAASRAPTPGTTVEAAAVRTDWRALLPAFLIAIAPVLLAQALLAWLPTLFVRERGLSPKDAALLIGGVTLVGAPAGPIIAGWLIGRFRRWEHHLPALVLLMLAASVAPLLGLVLAPSPAGAVASLSVMLVTLGMASFGGLFGIQLRSPAAARVSVNGVYLAFATTVGVGLGPLLAGAITSGGGASGPSLGSALLITAVLSVAVCALAVAADRRPVRP